MRTWLIAGALACSVLVPADALAIPGQSGAQCLAWGKANPAFVSFTRANDDESGGYEYFGFAKVGGRRVEFHAKPDRNGTIAMEEIASANLREAIATIYGKEYYRDLLSAVRAVKTRRVTVWRGKKLVYMTLGDVAFTVPLSRLNEMVTNAKRCDALDCSDGP